MTWTPCPDTMPVMKTSKSAAPGKWKCTTLLELLHVCEEHVYCAFLSCVCVCVYTKVRRLFSCHCGHLLCVCVFVVMKLMLLLCVWVCVLVCGFHSASVCEPVPDGITAFLEVWAKKLGLGLLLSTSAVLLAFQIHGS